MAPWFFVSVDSKQVRNPVSLLESRVRVSVAFNRVMRIPIAWRKMALGEGREEGRDSMWQEADGIEIGV
jgi:hypothetical protein